MELSIFLLNPLSSRCCNTYSAIKLETTASKMGNSESSPDEPFENHPDQPNSNVGYIVSTHNRPPSPEHPRSSTQTTHQHHPQAYTGASVNDSHSKKRHTAYIADTYDSLEEVINALREAGLESSNLILGIDFTKSNEWTGKDSFNRRSLHAIGSTPNPYEQAISIIGRTLSPFDDDNLIPCFGFGDATTHDQYAFSFYPDHRPCNGFEEALARYKEILPFLNLSGPTSFAPVIDAAIDIVEKSNFQYHVLVIIADGQVTRSSDTPPGRFSPQEQATINSIVTASEYPLSIILVGVGDGPWYAMKEFDDYIPQRAFDNFQFVNFTNIMSGHSNIEKKETAFALAALMEIPSQYRTSTTLHTKDKKIAGPGRRPLPPPRRVLDHDNAIKSSSHSSSLEAVESRSVDEQVCPICLTNSRNMAFGCGHMTCKDCGASISSCPLCRQPITARIRLYS
ncbi:E3 ubiquitin-protein ligase RGLG3-like isoform X1 [Primulina eburnea]|uniref:E3 ubiquitin-protein ligase RGLG3-like isoform X1 n=2 Tax=Primulina eburnea TaxID=1245227 RepID=UPI003C6C2E66